jgi:V/A-type H+-transporting ATPase subunit C
MAEQYIYAVTRVHAHEQGLLSKQDLEQLIAAPSLREAFQMLSDKGWGTPDLPQGDSDALLGYEQDRIWAFVTELMGDTAPFDVFRVQSDYHNLKAAIKLAFSADDQNEQGSYFMKFGTIPLEAIEKAAAEHDFKALPEALAAAGKEAYEILAHTQSGQMADMVIDRAALVAIAAAGKKSESALMRRYATLTVDVANIKSAVRCCRMGKNADFARRAVAPAGSLNTPKLIDAAAMDMDAICECLKRTDYADATEALKKSMSAFERWCDNKLMAIIKPQRKNYFTIEPIAAYILARENDIRIARLVLSAKQNDLSDDVLRERLRDTYV